ncbi:WSC domain-containing protein [Leptodontidium sp. MPI-SDFR-AT-0119]|nr:WSC domain-containing protein [Leptodontidium sp. MPI-SDFR-AT-0119]
MLVSKPTTIVLLGLTLISPAVCDVEPHFPHDPATTPYCTWWIDNDSTISCTDFIKSQNITLTDFRRWNPFITSACGNFGQYTSYCVEAFNEPTSINVTWTDLGCYVDNGGSRTLNNKLGTEAESQVLTRKSCQELCRSAGWTYCGVEWSQECWGANVLSGLPANDSPQSLCNLPCKGNASEICGGSERINVFQISTIPIFSSTSTVISSTTKPTSTTTSTTVKTTSAVATTTIQPVPTVAAWIPIGCYTDSGLSRTLSTLMWNNNDNTATKCQAACQAAGYLYAGVEFIWECYCGNEIRPPGVQGLDTSCNTNCAGDGKQTCGALGFLSMYYAVRT